MLKRHLVGVASLAFLAMGAWFLWEGTQSSGQELVMGSCLRIGSVLAVIWLAWPDLARLPPFLCVVGGASLLVMLRWPRLALYLLPIFVLLWLLRPRRGSSARPLTAGPNANRKNPPFEQCSDTDKQPPD